MSSILIFDSDVPVNNMHYFQLCRNSCMRYMQQSKKVINFITETRHFDLQLRLYHHFLQFETICSSSFSFVEFWNSQSRNSTGYYIVLNKIDKKTCAFDIFFIFQYPDGIYHYVIFFDEFSSIIRHIQGKKNSRFCLRIEDCFFCLSFGLM